VTKGYRTTSGLPQDDAGSSPILFVTISVHILLAHFNGPAHNATSAAAKVGFLRLVPSIEENLYTGSRPANRIFAHVPRGEGTDQAERAYRREQGAPTRDHRAR
jgi:hypothetical protein